MSAQFDQPNCSNAAISVAARQPQCVGTLASLRFAMADDHASRAFARSANGRPISTLLFEKIVFAGTTQLRDIFLGQGDQNDAGSAD
jgi:hypothetical protein